MGKLKFIAVILAASMAAVAAHGQDNGGGLVAPELSKPTRGAASRSGLPDVDRRDRPPARRLAVGGSDAARPRDPAAG